MDANWSPSRSREDRERFDGSDGVLGDEQAGGAGAVRADRAGARRAGVDGGRGGRGRASSDRAGEDDTGGNLPDEEVVFDGGDEYVDEGGYNPEYDREDPADNPWDETVIALLLVVGAILVLVPDPVTSAIGGLLLGLGVLAWVIDLIS